jgi:hypothetical protein
MVEFTSEPLEVKIGDIVIETNTHRKGETNPVTFYWVIYKTQDELGYGNAKKGYYAFSLSDENDKIGPMVFRSNEFWEYKVIHYD